MSEASKNGDARTFFSQYAILVSGARWQPSLGPEAAAFVQSVAAMAGATDRGVPEAPDQHAGDPLSRGDCGFRRRQLFLAANLSRRQSTGGRAAGHSEFNAAKAPVDNLTFAMHRVHGLVALAAARNCNRRPRRSRPICPTLHESPARLRRAAAGRSLSSPGP